VRHRFREIKKSGAARAFRLCLSPHSKKDGDPPSLAFNKEQAYSLRVIKQFFEVADVANNSELRLLLLCYSIALT
jgi:hypothetical protein